MYALCAACTRSRSAPGRRRPCRTHRHVSTTLSVCGPDFLYYRSHALVRSSVRCWRVGFFFLVCPSVCHLRTSPGGGPRRGGQNAGAPCTPAPRSSRTYSHF
ncbi:hypothetical protein TPACW86_0049 [Treponema pallidum subsp. pallidum]|nr:hypothetical protein TPAMA_0049 [Treponema pallidum subsp. pallidum str. Mexico A]AGN75269.1 hypothetical protein TPANIC_0049 [Treponema pallidum subsp. pallidum str. Nichols]AGN76246.1 hypothetical protein TPASS_20049 [Treponema pallidum subsp. pallidum SS14]QCP94400.1 hypothetical protein TPACW59_0049 [Treponema pallidum subsp. pallidum]QCP95371.1 hypothetical protein TPACW65_0049 [Treponema pallidum subsp. pallidum]